jgi:hypothetical protein
MRTKFRQNSDTIRTKFRYNSDYNSDEIRTKFRLNLAAEFVLIFYSDWRRLADNRNIGNQTQLFLKSAKNWTSDFQLIWTISTSEMSLP